jgi:hypothetical protein
MNGQRRRQRGDRVDRRARAGVGLGDDVAVADVDLRGGGGGPGGVVRLGLDGRRALPLPARFAARPEEERGEQEAGRTARHGGPRRKKQASAGADKPLI